MRTNCPPHSIRLIAAFCLIAPVARANPNGGTVTKGSASFSTKGPTFTIQQTSPFTHINWQNFNIGLGETTSILQPTATSILWNTVNSANPSQILGTLNANGFIILQNQSGIVVGGQAAITAHGVVLTTARMAPPDVVGGGAWQFSAPPPTAKIVNYGKINLGGGPAFLIANDIENQGAISNPGGQIGLIAGQDVLLSTSPDGRGLSAKVTLPQGSIDNSGKLIADGGSILMRAQVVNQGGLVQANSVRQVNGSIELYASDSVNLSADSMISAKGDSQGVSQGGSVVIQSGNAFTDAKGSAIDISGGAQGGNGGHVEISAPHVAALNSTINGHAANGYTAGDLLIDPDNIVLADGYGDSAPSSGIINAGDNPGSTFTLDFNTFNDLINNNQLSKICLAANYNIEVSGMWYVPDSTIKNSIIKLIAGQNILIDDSCGIVAGQNWNLNLTAGKELTSAANRQAGLDGIYLGVGSILQTQNGNINLSAANEVVLDYDYNPGSGPTTTGVTTWGGGGINVTTTYGDVNSGYDAYGYTFLKKSPYYKVDPNLGGISTAAGGNVNVNAGGNVFSYLPTSSDVNHYSAYEGGIGAYSPTAAGNVTVTAQNGNIYGHFVEADGQGIVSALNGDVGAPLTSQGFALSLAKGGWTVNAPNGSIYLQEVRNPNGVFNSAGGNISSPAYHNFDYSPDAFLSLNADNTVQITGLGIPRGNEPVPIIFPPSLEVSAGPGGFILSTESASSTADVILFPSSQANLNINTAGGGNFVGNPGNSGAIPTLSMSGSGPDANGNYRWTSSTSFTFSDRAPLPTEPVDNSPLNIHISGSMETVNLFTSRQTTLKVDGDIVNSSFIGQNWTSGDTTKINVTGNIKNQPYYSFDTLTSPITPADPLNPTWYSIFSVLVNPSLINSTVLPANMTVSDLKTKAALMAAFLVSPGSSPNPGFVYDAATKQLGYGGVMSSATLSALTGTLEAITYDANGVPLVANGHFVTHPVAFVNPSVIQDLYTQSQLVPPSPLLGFQLGGPGQFNITANSINLGSSEGIESWGIGDLGKVNYANLQKYSTTGASITVNTTGDLDMVTSRIASFDGGDVNVQSKSGSMNLGSQDLFGSSAVAYGIYTSGHNNSVNVEAAGDINIEGSRIAAYNGGGVTIKSDNGTVNTGSGGNIYVDVPVVLGWGYNSGKPFVDMIEQPIYGSGVLAISLPPKLLAPGFGSIPGDITISTPNGSIISGAAGVLQLALDGNNNGTPSVTLTAADKIDLGDFPLIGGKITLTAPDVNGEIFSRDDLTISATRTVNVTAFSGGQANVSGQNVVGVVVGVKGVSASGDISGAQLVSQNVSANGGATQSTLGATANAMASTQSAVQQTTAETKQQTFDNNALADDNSKKKKTPVLQRIKRVTVILPKT